MTRSPSATPVRASATRRLAALALAVALVPACGSTPPSRFYVLAPTTELNPAAEPEVHLGLETVVLPDSVDRPQMVTVVSAHERRVSELDRWAEPLTVGATRVLGQYLEAEFGATSVVPLRNRYGPELDGVVAVEVLTFDARPSGDSTLVARVDVQIGNWRQSGRVASTFDNTFGDSGAPAVARGLSAHMGTVAHVAAELVRAGLSADAGG